MSPTRVIRLTESNWRVFADLRLRALTDTLGAEDPQFRRESSFSTGQWRRRLRAHAQFAVLLDGRLVGLIGAQRDSSDSVYLYSLWLEPAARGRGLGHLLVSTAVDWARGERARVVTLRVDAGNDGARGVYERIGFVAMTPGNVGELTMSLTVG